MIKPSWSAVVAPGVHGYITRWNVQKGERFLSFGQLPYLRAEERQRIVAHFPRAGDLTAVAAQITLDDGNGYMIAFNLDPIPPS